VKHHALTCIALALLCAPVHANDPPAPTTAADLAAPDTENTRPDDANPTAVPSQDAPSSDATPSDDAPADASDPGEESIAPVSVSENATEPVEATEQPALEAPVAPPVDEGFSLEKKVVPWVTVAAGVISVVGAAALIAAGGVPFYAVWDLEQKLTTLESEDPSNIERAKLLQQSAGLRRKEWNQYGAPLVTSGIVLLVAGGVFIAGGLITGMGLMDGAE